MLGSRGIVERALGHPEQAEASLEEAIAVGRAQKHRSLAPNMIELAGLLCDRRRFAQADRLLAEASPILTADYPDEEWRPAWLRLTRAKCLAAQGRGDAARRMAAAARPALTERWPAGTYYRFEADGLR